MQHAIPNDRRPRLQRLAHVQHRSRPNPPRTVPQQRQKAAPISCDLRPSTQTHDADLTLNPQKSQPPRLLRLLFAATAPKYLHQNSDSLELALPQQ